MKLKLDENLGNAAVRILTHAGHDVATTIQQGLQGAEDTDIISICQNERLCLVTLDLGFSNTLLFPPTLYSGIAVLRPRTKPSHPHVLACVETLSKALHHESIAGKLWIVEANRVRIHRASEAE